MSTLREQIRQMPGWMKAALVGVLALGVYFGVVDPLVSGYREEAARLERLLQQRAAQRSGVASMLGELERAMTALGRPKLPVSGDPMAALDELLSTLRADFGLVERERIRAVPSQLTIPATIRWLTLSGEPRLDRYSIEWRFECGTAELLGVLEALERSPVVHAIGSLSIRKAADPRTRFGDGADQLAVILTVESWATPSGAATLFPKLAESLRPARSSLSTWPELPAATSDGDHEEEGAL
jgi:hypothetical protein